MKQQRRLAVVEFLSSKMDDLALPKQTYYSARHKVEEGCKVERLTAKTVRHPRYLLLSRGQSWNLNLVMQVFS